MNPIPLSTPTMNGSEMGFVREAFDTNWIAPLGPHVDAFEGEICRYVGIGHGAALGSGTAAIHLGLKCAGVSRGDVVFCSNLTFAATCNPIIYESAIPVFVDSEKDSWNMCPDALEAAFVKYPGARAVIVVHLYGTPARMDEIAEICRRHGAALIEDAAESLGATYKGRQTASFGDFNILSFNGNKIITTSGGGMLLSDDEAAIQKARFWATQSRDPAPHYQHSELGYNYRMSNICAAIGRGQLTTLDLRISQKTDIYNAYKKAFTDCDIIHLNPIPGDCVPNHWLSCIALSPGADINPEAIRIKLAENNIEARAIWKPMSLQPYYSNCDFIAIADTPISHDIFARGLCLPSDVKMNKEEQARVCDLIYNFCY